MLRAILREFGFGGCFALAGLASAWGMLIYATAIDDSIASSLFWGAVLSLTGLSLTWIIPDIRAARRRRDQEEGR